MKKVSIVTLTLLLMTNSMTQTVPGQVGDGGQAFRQFVEQNLSKVLNGSMNLQGLSTYAQGLSAAIANLATSTQPQDMKKMKLMFATINAGVKKYAPKATQSAKRSADQIKSDLLAAVGGTLSFASLATYASQFSTALATLTTTSTGDQVAPVVNMLVNIGAGLKQLAPQTQPTQQEEQGQQA